MKQPVKLLLKAATVASVMTAAASQIARGKIAGTWGDPDRPARSGLPGRPVSKARAEGLPPDLDKLRRFMGLELVPQPT